MKDKINRLAKGITEDERPLLKVRPGAFGGIVYPDKTNSFVIECEAANGRSLKGVCYCDEARVEFQNASFLGRMSENVFTVNAAGLPAGHILSGTVKLTSNAGEFTVPYEFAVGEAEKKNESEKAVSFESVPNLSAFRPSEEEDRYISFLKHNIPDDTELIAGLAEELIKNSETGDLAFTFYREAIRRELKITHLYESYVAAYPEDSDEPMPREVLLYYSYERTLSTAAADKLYRSIIKYEPSDSELYMFFEPMMRDFAMKSVLDKRMNSSLRVIYDRMIYPDMIDLKAASVLPDLFKSHRITVDDPQIKNVHVKYPELKRIKSEPVRDGKAYIPVYFKNAVISFADRAGRELSHVSFRDEEMLDRPDVLKRCFQLVPSHPMLVLSAAKQILRNGVKEDREKDILIRVMRELEPEEYFRGSIIKALCEYGGDISWMDQCSPSELSADAGGYALKAYLDAGRYRDAYLYVRMTGMERVDTADLSRLAAALLSRGEKPVANGIETDRFFICMCKRIFDAKAASAQILTFLSEEYEGSGPDMFRILKETASLDLPVSGLPEKTLMTMLYTEQRELMDEAFRLYLEYGVQKETVIKAYFVIRMSDYFEQGDTSLPAYSFDALRDYLKINRYHEGLPVVLLLAVTRYYSEKDSLTADETALCQKITDILIGRGLVFRYTKALRKKISVPGGICEKFFIEYRGAADSVPSVYVRFQDDGDYSELNTERVYKNIFVASAVIFYKDTMEYRIVDKGIVKEEGVISVKKLHGKDEDRYALLNRMTRALSEGDTGSLLKDMLKYSVDTEVNRSLFTLSGLEK